MSTSFRIEFKSAPFSRTNYTVHLVARHCQSLQILLHFLGQTVVDFDAVGPESVSSRGRMNVHVQERVIRGNDLKHQTTINGCGKVTSYSVCHCMAPVRFFFAIFSSSGVFLAPPK